MEWSGDDLKQFERMEELLERREELQFLVFKWELMEQGTGEEENS